MDGSTRSSLQMFLERSAHRPFAFRILAPTAIKVLDEALPSALRIELADTVAPILFEKYVSHFVKKHERFVPVMSKRSTEDWSHSEYRSRYVLMVALMFCSLSASILLMHRAAIKLGATSAGANAAMILYAMVMPTMFLNGGYFYDFIEQLGALALICLALAARVVYIAANAIKQGNSFADGALSDPLLATSKSKKSCNVCLASNSSVLGVVGIRSVYALGIAWQCV
jgi:hypothetical protein